MFQFGWNCFSSEGTKITVTFMKEISYIASQLFRNDEYHTEEPLRLFLGQRSWLKQAVCPTRKPVFFPLEAKTILASRGIIHGKVSCLCPHSFSLMDGILLTQSPWNSLKFTVLQHVKTEKSEYNYVQRQQCFSSQLSSLAYFEPLCRQMDTFFRKRWSLFKLPAICFD